MSLRRFSIKYAEYTDHLYTKTAKEKSYTEYVMSNNKLQLMQVFLAEERAESLKKEIFFILLNI